MSRPRLRLRAGPDYYGATKTRTRHCNGVTELNLDGMAKIYPIGRFTKFKKS